MTPAPSRSDDLKNLLSLQTRSGAFPSYVEAGDIFDDETNFVTAQIAIILVRLLEARANNHKLLRPALESALDFVETCELPETPGAFHFYAQVDKACRLDIDIAPDADDTALAWSALVLGGRRLKADAREALKRNLVPADPAIHRRGDPPWLRAGAIRTWIGDEPVNPVDLCVNTNVIFALQVCGVGRDPLTGGPIETVNAGLKTSRGDAAFWRRLTPFYAHPAELSHALDRAVAAGAVALEPAAILAAQAEAQDRRSGRPGDRPLYCNSHGRPVWRSPALQLARRIVDAVNPVSVDPSLSPHGDQNDIHASFGA